MKVLVVGSGGREHALAWRLSLSPRVSGLWVAGGNSGTAELATNIPVSPEDINGVVSSAREIGADLVVVGPEQPLVDGLADQLEVEGIPVFGPSKEAAQIEASKSFARQVMVEAGVPGPDYRVFRDQADALDFVVAHGDPVVVKADGLAAGKGVALCSHPEEAVLAVKGCMADRIFGLAGATIVVEEWLQGTEVSVFAFCDGEVLSAPVAACDYKQAGDGDEGPNTGGMGSFAPPPFWNEELAQKVSDSILKPTIARMAAMGRPYRGVLYAGLMFTDDGPKVLEFNCRFGDPEAQVILPLLESDPVDVMMDCANHGLAENTVRWSKRPHVGVVMVSGGYPGGYETGKAIAGLEEGSQSDGQAGAEAETLVFHAGAASVRDERGITRVVTSGGRVLTVVGRGESIEQAREAAYKRVGQINFEDVRYRNDIGDLSSGNRSRI